MTLQFDRSLLHPHQAAVHSTVKTEEEDEADAVMEKGDVVEVEAGDATPVDLVVKVLGGGFLMKTGRPCLNMRRRKLEMKGATMLPNKKSVN